jgi:DNA polymerase-4
VQELLRARTSLACSVGIGDNKLQAKLASGFAKPAGIFRLSFDSWRAVMGKKSVDHLWGVGRKRARQLATMSISTVDDLAAADAEALGHAFGPSTGPWLIRVARGEDGSPVDPRRRRARSLGREKTFETDLVERAAVEEELRHLATEVAREVAERSARAARVVVKLRWAPFFTRTRGVTLERPTANRAAIERAALEAFALQYEERAVRLVGVRCELSGWKT